MLVLSRKQGESIVIDGDIRVTVLKAHGKVIRLGIEAPKEVPIRRSELDFRLADAPSQLDLDARDVAEPLQFSEMGALI